LNVYCVLAHNEPANLKSLLNTLQGKKVLVHLDKSVDRAQYLMELASLPAQVEVLDLKDSFRIEWGGWNMVRAEILLFRNALRFLKPGDHAILLSGACYPCRPLADFEYFLSQNTAKELISFNSLGNVQNLRILPTGQGYWKVQNINLHDMIALPPFPPIVKGAYKLRDFINKRRLPNPQFRSEYAYFVGSQWIALTAGMTSQLVRNENYLKRRFRYSYAPDELAIQSFIINTLGPDSDALIGEDFDTFATISGPIHYLKPGSLPATIEDLEAITESGKFFVRKPTDELRKMLAKGL